ncbi:Exosome complex component CSL4 [Lamellibrachia satsuma]|nr:Exosome complex component CSL4 [Lamellibrachia satsuma]
MAAANGVVCVPGQWIDKLDGNRVAGKGTYSRNGVIVASLAGFVHHAQKESGMTEIEVRTEVEDSIVPSVNSMVKAKITNVNPRFCKCAILGVVGNASLQESFRGIIRREDVRATEKDKVEMYKCFRPGDIILARVLSLGDAQSYVLTTAENELGVVIARSEEGFTMVPISWCEMKCPKSHLTEFRKVAKVRPEHIQASGIS